MKKKILNLLFIFTLMFCSTYNVMADDLQTSADYTPPDWSDYLRLNGSTSLGGRNLSESEICEWGGYSGLVANGITILNAVRMTIVDLNTGARVSKSVDFYSGSLPRTFNRHTYVGTGNKTRNEIISGGGSYNVLDSRPYLNYWASLPEFVQSGGGATLREYFISKYSSEDLMDMVLNFSLMEYEGYKNAGIYENHALLVEPIFQIHVMTPTGDDGCREIEMLSRSEYQRFVDWYSNSYLKTCDMNCSSCANKCKTWSDLLERAQQYNDYRPGMWGAKLGTESFEICDCELSRRYYYGTATEIFYMMQRNDDRILTYKLNDYGSVKTIISNIGSLVHDNKDVGGLWNATGVANPSEAYKHILDKFGLGTMHIWMKEIIDGEKCIDSNGVAWDIPEGLTSEQIALFKNEHCPSPTEPSDEYCPINSNHPEKMIPANVVDNDTLKQQWIQENCYDDCVHIASEIKSYDNGLINDCNNSNTVNTFEDTDRWDCIYDTINYANANTYAYEYYHPNGDTTYDDNPYCSVACRESISITLPKEFEVVAGGRFTIGASGEYNVPSVQPNQIVGKTECYTAYPQRGVNVAGINLEQFKIDYTAADNAVIVAWNNWQNAKANLKAFENATEGARTTHNESCTGPLISNESSCPGGWDEQLVNRDGTPTSQQACDDCSAVAAALSIPDCGCHTARTCPGGYGQVVDTEHCTEWEHGGSTRSTYWSSTWTGTWSNGVYSGTASYDTTEDGYHIAAGRDKASVKAAIEADIKQKETLYEQALAYRDAVYNNLMACNNFQRTFSEFNPQMSFAYGETKYRLNSNMLATVMQPITSLSNYMVNNELVDVPVLWDTVEYTNSESTYIQNYTELHGSISDNLPKHSCGPELTACSDGTLTYPSNTSVGQFTTKIYEYEIPDNVYRYITKKDGVSFNTYEEASLLNYPYDDVIDTGHSNLPISYDTRPGYYNYFIDYYYVNGSPNLFGTNQKFYKYNQIAPGSQSSFNGLTLANNLYYHCRYKVKCGLIEPCTDQCEACDGNLYPAGSSECNKECPPTNDKTCTDPCTGESRIIPQGKTAAEICPNNCSDLCPDGRIRVNGECPCSGSDCGGGIRIIYRPISLNDPFPGEHGNGRDSGANWVGEATVLGTTKSFIDAYITNNRGVTTEEVYKETPMYEFTLNASNIRAIRRYNNSKHDDYNDSDLNCTNGKYCKSEFLEQGLASGYFNFSTEVPTGGTCLNAYSTNWESCRYSNIGG